MNARVPDRSTSDRVGELSLSDAARELRVAGEALVRASAAIANLGSRLARGQGATASKANDALPVDQLQSSRQLGAIRSMARRAGLSRDALAELIEKIAGKQEPSELSRSEASSVLDRLGALVGFHR